MNFDADWQQQAFGDLQSCAGEALADLTADQLICMQRGLWFCGYDAGPIDGLLGSRTKSAWSEFTADLGFSPEDGTEPAVIAMENRIDGIIHVLTLEQENYDQITTQSTESIGQSAIVNVAEAMGIFRKYQQIAYIFATVQHETAAQWKPVIEGYWMPEGWQDENLTDYAPYYGRGFVQLTWQSNYQKYGDILCIPLVDKPDLALDYNVSLFVLINGFRTGAFTSKCLEQYVNDSTIDYPNARRCINGTDKAAEIAELARGYEHAAFDLCD